MDDCSIDNPCSPEAEHYLVRCLFERTISVDLLIMHSLAIFPGYNLSFDLVFKFYFYTYQFILEVSEKHTEGVFWHN